MSINIDIREFEPENVPLSCSMIIVAAPKSGKSTFTKNMVYYNRHRYPSGTVFNGVEKDYKEWKKINGTLFTHPEWDAKKEQAHLNRTKTCQKENGETYIGNASFNIIDDVLNEAKDWRSPLMKFIFQKATQHHQQLTMVCTQYIVALPPEVRGACTYYVIGGNWSAENRAKIFANLTVSLGGKSKKENEAIFNALIDQVCTTKYRFLIFKNDGDGEIMYYDVKPVPEFRIGAPETIEWNDTRYNKDYREADLLDLVK